MPGQANIEVWKGNTLSRTFRFKVDETTPLDLTGSTLVFRALWSGGNEIRKNLTVATPVNGEAVLDLSVVETRSLPNGAVAKYEIERRMGGAQTTLLYGTLVATEWVNDDV